MSKITVYSSNVGNIDNSVVHGQPVVLLSHDRFFKSNRMRAKKFKVLPHFYFESEFTLWIDANVRLNKTKDYFLELLGDADVLIFLHPDREFVRQEAETLKLLDLDDEDIINEMVAKIDKLGGGGYPLCSCRLILRRNNDQVRRACENWWAWISTGSFRDQLSFPFSFKDCEIRYLSHPDSYDNQYFTVFGRSKPGRMRMRLSSLIKKIFKNYE